MKKPLIRIILFLLIGELTATVTFFRAHGKVTDLKDNGAVAIISSEYDIHGRYHNYYFMTPDSTKVAVTSNINKKNEKTDEKIYKDKEVMYDPANPENYMLKSRLEKNHLLKFFIIIPAVIILFLSAVYALIKRLKGVKKS